MPANEKSITPPSNDQPTRTLNEELVQLTKDIAKELGGAWTFKPLDEPYPTQYISGPNEAEIAVRIETYGSRKGRVEINGNFHIGRDREFIDVREWNHSTSERCKLPEISVSGTRGAVAITKEIKRRFLPEYLPLLQKAIEKRDAATSWEDKTRANLITLAAIVNASVPTERDRTTASFYHNDKAYGDIQCSGDSISLKLSSLTMEQAKRILSMLAEKVGQ
jgi:hypothetical protein